MNKNSRVTVEGVRLGLGNAKLAMRGEEILKEAGLNNIEVARLRTEMCKTCACRVGTVPTAAYKRKWILLKPPSKVTHFYVMHQKTEAFALDGHECERH